MRSNQPFTFLSAVNRATLTGTVPSIAKLGNAVLTILIGLTLSHLTWLAWPVGNLVPHPITDSRRLSADTPGIDLDAIVSAELFGHRTHSGSAQDESLDAPETALELELTGIVSDSNGGRERALIRADDSLEEQSFARGDEIIAGTRLHAIHRTHVVLDRGGRFEKLSLPLDKAPTNRTSDKDESLPRGDAAFQAVRDEVAADPSAIQQYVNIQGYYRDDRLQGFRVYPTDKGKPYFERLGLPPGTLIRSVNGLPLDGSVNWEFVGQELAQAVHLELVVGRERQQRLSLKIR